MADKLAPTTAVASVDIPGKLGQDMCRQDDSDRHIGSTVSDHWFKDQNFVNAICGATPNFRDAKELVDSVKKFREAYYKFCNSPDSPERCINNSPEFQSMKSTPLPSDCAANFKGLHMKRNEVQKLTREYCKKITEMECWKDLNNITVCKDELKDALKKSEDYYTDLTEWKKVLDAYKEMNNQTLAYLKPKPGAREFRESESVTPTVPAPVAAAAAPVPVIVIQALPSGSGSQITMPRANYANLTNSGKVSVADTTLVSTDVDRQMSGVTQARSMLGEMKKQVDNGKSIDVNAALANSSNSPADAATKKAAEDAAAKAKADADAAERARIAGLNNTNTTTTTPDNTSTSSSMLGGLMKPETLLPVAMVAGMGYLMYKQSQDSKNSQSNTPTPATSPTPPPAPKVATATPLAQGNPNSNPNAGNPSSSNPPQLVAHADTGGGMKATIGQVSTKDLSGAARGPASGTPGAKPNYGPSSGGGPGGGTSLPGGGNPGAQGPVAAADAGGHSDATNPFEISNLGGGGLGSGGNSHPSNNNSMGDLLAGVAEQLGLGGKKDNGQSQFLNNGQGYGNYDPNAVGVPLSPAEQAAISADPEVHLSLFIRLNAALNRSVMKGSLDSSNINRKGAKKEMDFSKMVGRAGSEKTNSN